MKRLLALLLCLMLCLPALAENEIGNLSALQTIDFGPFTMRVGANDYYAVADTMTSNTVYAQVYKDYYLTGSTVSNLNVVYSADNITAEIASVGGIENYGNIVLQNAGSQLEAAGYQFSNPVLHAAEFSGNVGYIAYSYTLAPANTPDEKINLLLAQYFYCLSANENYIISVTSDNESDLLMLASYVEDSLTFKDSAPAEPSVVDFGTFTMELGPNDQYEVAAQMNSNEIYTIIYLNYDPSAMQHDNINVVWNSADISSTVKLYGAEAYAQAVLDSAAPQYEAMGIKSSNARVLTAQHEDNLMATVTSMDLDYTGAGIDMVTTLYQMQGYFFRGAEGTYVFTISTTSMAQLQEYTSYLDAVVFK